MRRSRSTSLAFTLLIATACQGAIGQGYTGQGLTGDWCGNRDWLACQGVTFDLDHAHFGFGTASGGLDERFNYGGHGDYVMNADLGKLGVQEGLFLKIRAEHRWGESISNDTGALLPATVLADLPIADSEQLYITNFLFTQMLSETTGVFFGKLDTLDGDLNAFAHGRGKTQFSNIGFVASPIVLRSVPYATLGCGLVVLGAEGEPVFTYTLLNATDTADSAGFNELFEEGVSMSAEGRLPTSFGGLPGHQLLGVSWNNREFVEIGQDPRFVLPNVPINRVDGSWSVYWNFDQYLQVDPCNPKRGWGLFGRAGVADGDTNPIEWFLSFGVGGNSPVRGREADTFGLGWFISGTSSEVGTPLQALLGPIGDGQAVEMFYNWQATPWLNITPDLQVVMPARESTATALVLGVRAVTTY
ncbi:Carbohydrate-selective porin, OprB family [Pseudobythopirellula maris]|uniref:Carbohydrate-selective porin, OprB family n=1 Tax=Pseudobythopirellula maris TaxID=2527991 RepID=A0A5C5ZJS4_9BACT|nr:carbohydrate porin [Pseudobythopirellula maris]TWT87486.1 Carbohydrate-selective porin, OprB family [Pseudobythopirellula maris]